MNMANGGLRFMRAASIIGVVLVAVAFGTRTLGQYDRPPPPPCGVPYEVQLDISSQTGCRITRRPAGLYPWEEVARCAMGGSMPILMFSLPSRVPSVGYSSRWYVLA